MKKILITLLILATLILSACASTSSSAADPVSTAANGSSKPTANTNQGGNGSVQLNTNFDNAAPVSLQLLLGTYMLAGTDQAIAAEEASTLLPLWKEYKSLTMKNTPGQGTTNPGQVGTPAAPQSTDADTQAQIESLLVQIQSAMTPAQIEAIAAMKITQDTAMSFIQQMGMPSGGQPPANGSGSQTPSNGSGGQPPAGGPGNGTVPAGTPPANGQMSNPPTGGAGMFPPGVLDALIQQLQNISTGQSSSTNSPVQNSNPASGSTSSTTSSTSADFTLDSGSQSLSGQSYSASATDESGIYVTGGASLTLTQAKVSTSGDSSSSDESSFHGLNAAVLANSASEIQLSNSTVISSGSGGNGVFAEGAGTQIDLSDVSINASGHYAHAVMATNGGALSLTNVDMITAGANSAAIATDRGGGTINVSGGSATTSGVDSPGIYSTGDITVTRAKITATGSEAAVIEGSNSITLKDTDLSGEKKWGAMIYQSMSGDADGVKGSFSMSGGTVNFSADAQTLSGDVVADSLSAVNIDLTNGSSLSGAINNANSAKAVSLSLDASSTWTVTADSYLTCLSDAQGISGTMITNINANGNTVYYDANACPDLGGNTYSLNGGGKLIPMK